MSNRNTERIIAWVASALLILAALGAGLLLEAGLQSPYYAGLLLGGALVALIVAVVSGVDSRT